MRRAELYGEPHVHGCPPTGMLNTMATDADPGRKEVKGVNGATEGDTLTLNTGASLRRDREEDKDREGGGWERG